MENKRKNAKKDKQQECELLQGGMPEAAESAYNWKRCTKNPGHLKFTSAQDFKDTHLPKVQNVRSREALQAWVDLTVKLRVHFTSPDRPDEDAFAQIRGTAMRRTGTGFIHKVCLHDSNKACPCVECDGKTAKKHWEFLVRTAHHVVYNSEEAKQTKVDLFLDDESSEQDSRLACVGGVEVEGFNSDWDWRDVLCVTCDQDLGQRILLAERCYERPDRILDLDLSSLDLLAPRLRDSELALVISHPHGQPKKITVGEWREDDQDFPRAGYTAPTCPGSSGAPVFRLKYNSITRKFDILDLSFNFSRVHSGSYGCSEHEEQLNFGFYYFYHRPTSRPTPAAGFSLSLPLLP